MIGFPSLNENVPGLSYILLKHYFFSVAGYAKAGASWIHEILVDADTIAKCPPELANVSLNFLQTTHL